MTLTQISTAGVKDDAVTAGKIPANAVGSSELADNAVDTAAIADNAVTAGKLASGVQTTINNNADDKVITGSGTANTLEGESSNYNFVGGTLRIKNSANDTQYGAIYGDATSFHLNGGSPNLLLYSGGGERMRILSGGEVAIGGTGYAGQPFSVQTSGASVGYLQSTGTTRATLGFVDANSTVNVGFGAIGNNHVFMKDGSEKARIDSSGRVKIGTIDGSPHANADELTLGDPSGTVRSGMTLNAGANKDSSIHFGDPDNNSSGQINYDHNGDILRFYTDNTKRVRIDSDGLKFGNDTAAANALDDYEEGTWTPVILDGNGSNYSISPNAAQCHYTKIGRMVYIFYNITNNEGGSKTGDLYMPVSCLPFTPSPAVQASGTFFVDHGGPRTGLGDIIGGNHNVGTGAVYFTQPTRKNNGDTQSTANNRYLAHGQWTNGRPIYGEFSYKVA